MSEEILAEWVLKEEKDEEGEDQRIAAYLTKQGKRYVIEIDYETGPWEDPTGAWSLYKKDFCDKEGAIKYVECLKKIFKKLTIGEIVCIFLGICYKVDSPQENEEGE